MSSAFRTGYPNMESFAPVWTTYSSNKVEAPLNVNVVPDQNHSYQPDTYTLRKYGIAQIIFAITTWIICIFPIMLCPGWFGNYGDAGNNACLAVAVVYGAGFPAGLFYLVAGILGICVWRKKTRRLATAFLVFSIIATVCAFVILFVCFLLVINKFHATWLLGSAIQLALVSLLEMAVAYMSCQKACRTDLTCCTCCSRVRTDFLS